MIQTNEKFCMRASARFKIKQSFFLVRTVCMNNRTLQCLHHRLPTHHLQSTVAKFIISLMLITHTEYRIEGRTRETERKKNG